MKKLYNQVKRYQWREDEYSMPVIARFGTGGGNVPIIVERRVYDGTRRHDYAEFEDDVCETVQSHYGTGGG